MAELSQLFIGQNWALQLDLMTGVLTRFEQILLRADHHLGGGD